MWLTPVPQTRTLELDLQRSEISFSIDHMGFLTVEGTFSEFEASLKLENDLISLIEGEIQVVSIRTEEPTRDETLKSPGYLDAERYPVISFSSGFNHPISSENQITGQLRIKSVEREIVVPFQMEQVTSTVILTVEGAIHRSDFNLDFGTMDALIGDEIRVLAKLVFID